MNMMDELSRKWIKDEANLLLQKAQNGDRRAENDLLDIIRTKYMPSRIGRYLGKNRQVDNDDLKQEFMIGVALNIQRAKLDMGDPIEYIMKCGNYRVRSYMRSHILKGTMQLCNECGSKSRLNRVGNQYVCKTCGASGDSISTTEVDDHNEITLQNIQDKGFEDYTISDTIMTEFEKTLIPGTNVHSLYLMLKSGIDRDNPAIKNYIKEIAKAWGGCSDQNVVQNLDKLRSRLKKFMEDNKIEYCIAQ